MVEKVARSISCLALMEEIMNIIYEKWDEILETVKTEHELSDVSFKTWLKPLTIHSIDDQVVTILVPSQQVGLNYISKKYALPLKVAISELTGSDYDIKFVLPEDIQNVEKEVPVSTNYNTSMEMANLNPKYTFDTFVVGSNNKFAHAASLAVAESPGEIYNPLFLYGGDGLGKTQQNHSVAHIKLERNPSTKILKTTSEEFTNELIEAIRNGNNTAMTKFREKYRNIDVLLIDDIQFIIGKESTQEEFFHTFNALHSAKKQIIISSDKPPKDMEILEDRIRSRFEWGLLADISSPDYETRVAILRKKEEMDGYNLDDSIIEYIAKNIKSNIRELEGAFNKIIAFAKLNKVDLTLSLAEEALKDVIYPNKPKEITPTLIINVVAEHFGVKPEDITSKKRNSEFVQPRQVVMYLCRELTDTSFTNIGKLLGKKDHTTIIHGVNKVSAEIQTNEELRNKIDIITKKINPS